MINNPKPYCYILTPFGVKKDRKSDTIDIDDVHNNSIIPAILDAELEPIRTDEKIVGGSVHKTKNEEIILCDHNYIINKMRCFNYLFRINTNIFLNYFNIKNLILKN